MRMRSYSSFSDSCDSVQTANRASKVTERSICLADEEQHEPKSLRQLSRTQILTLVSICFTTTCSSSFYSLLAPFFSVEAITQKGASEIEVGFIFGIFQGVVFLMSPIFGHFMVQIGPKFMYVSGIFVASTCAILFGTLQWCPPGLPYVFMCFAVRIVEAIAAAACSTAALAIAAHTFPENLAKVMGLIEVCSSLGLMLGPPMGGILYSAGGFYLPFYVTGTAFMMGGLLSFILMPSFEGEAQKRNVSNWSLLRLPVVFIAGYMVFIGQASIGFFDVGLSQQLEKIKPGISKIYVGLIFVVPSISVIVLAPINGFLVDKDRQRWKPIIVMGSSIGALGVMFLGPSPLMPYLPTDEIWVPIIALVLSGMGLSCLMVTYQAFVGAAIDAGYEITLEVQGIISGTYNAFNSLGALVGPTLGGVMLQHLSFEWCATIFGFGVGLAAIMIATYSIILRFQVNPCISAQQQDDEEHIIN